MVSRVAAMVTGWGCLISTMMNNMNGRMACHVGFNSIDLSYYIPFSTDSKMKNHRTNYSLMTCGMKVNAKKNPEINFSLNSP